MSDPENVCCSWPGRALRAEQEQIALSADVERLRAENTRFRKALQPYAKYTNWATYATVDQQYIYWCGPEADPSRLARAVLEESE